MTTNRENPSLAILACSAAGALISCRPASKKPEWAAKNEKLSLIKRSPSARATTSRIHKSPGQPGRRQVVTNLSTLPVVELAPGVKARMYWGKGNLVGLAEPRRRAPSIPKETLPAERIMVVMKGEIEQLLGGKFVPCRPSRGKSRTAPTAGRPKNEFVYLRKGRRERPPGRRRRAPRSSRSTGRRGPTIWPRRALKDVPAKPEPDFPDRPDGRRPGRIYDLNDSPVH